METLRLGDVKWLAQYPGVSDGWNAALKPVIFAADSSLLTLYLLVSTFSWKEKKQNKTFFFFCLFRPTPSTYGGSRTRGRIGLHHRHSNAGSELCLWPAPQLTAAPDPWPTEWGQGSNLHPHGCQSVSLITPSFSLREVGVLGEA